MTFLSVRDVRKSFGPVEVLHGINLDVESGSVTALLGENGAGKSTLVRILAGDHTLDSGTISVQGTQMRSGDISYARGVGIRLITQEISDVPTLSVAENISLGNWPGRIGLASRKKMRERAQTVLTQLDAHLDLDRMVSELRLGERQIVEIARALNDQSRCLILDEPTAALSDIETRKLFEVITSLRQKGVAIIYITHRLDEVFEISDRVAVLRDGHISLCDDTDVLTPQTVVKAMVGRDVEVQRYVSKAPDRSPQEPILRLIEAESAGAFADLSISLQRRKVVGLYGKIGSGVAEVGEALFGIRKLTAGHLQIGENEHSLKNSAEAIGKGIGYLPPDRKDQAILTKRSVAENLAAPSWKRLSFGKYFITRAKESAAYQRWHSVLNVRSRNDPTQIIDTLSGGNQQKILLARWFECDSQILVLVEPSRGVDIGARQEIYQSIRQLADDGAAIIVISSDYEDIIAVADEAHVMVRGNIVATHVNEEINVEELTESAGGTKKTKG